MAKFSPKISQPIRPLMFKGGCKGILLLHGFTATPDSLRFLAETLHEEDFTVSVPVLAGHGTHESHLAQTLWQDWYQSAEKAYLKLSKECESVSVVGLSLGGLLTLHLAYSYPHIKALGLLATPLFLDGWLIRTLFPLIWKTPLKYLYRYQKKHLVSINDPLARRRHQTYGRIPVSSVANLLDLQKKVRRELFRVHQPTFIAHALDDETVPYGNLDFIRVCLGSDEIETLTLKRSNHIITVDYDKEIVAERLLRFLKNKMKRE